MIKSCAERTLKNIERGYTVEYPTAGKSLGDAALEYASAGGLVVEPEITPINVK